MKRTRATRGCITRTIYETHASVTLYNKELKKVEIAKKTLKSTKNLSDVEIERQIEKIFSDAGVKVLDITVERVDEQMYAMTIDTFVTHGEKVENEEAKQED